MKNKIKDKPSAEAKLVCPVCNKPMKSKLGLHSHMRSHPKEVTSDKKVAVPVEEIKAMPVLDVKAEIKEPEPIPWVKKNGKKKSALTPCIVIDKFKHWHENAMINLGDIDLLPFTWGYYGKRLPVLTEKNNKLEPYLHSDMVGESCNLLYKMGHPDGFKNTFKHVNSLLQKIQIGLMVAIVLGIFGLIYVMVSG
jgi:hypothetical protein